jgi:hypothetical protein
VDSLIHPRLFHCLMFRYKETKESASSVCRRRAFLYEFLDYL